MHKEKRKQLKRQRREEEKRIEQERKEREEKRRRRKGQLVLIWPPMSVRLNFLKNRKMIFKAPSTVLHRRDFFDRNELSRLPRYGIS